MTACRLWLFGKVYYIYWNGFERGFGRGAPGGTQSDISAWVTSACKPVQGFDTQTRNMGAPDGTGSQGGNLFSRGPGGMQVTL